MNQLNMTSIAAGAGMLTLYKSFTSLVSVVKGFSQQALQSYSHFEQIESGLQGVLKDVKKGTDMFEDLRKFSFDTTFGVDTLANAAQQLIGVGESASTLKTTLLQLGNVASGDTNKFNELVSIFAKIQNTGKAGSMQLQQLALRGVPIYQYLKQIGVQGTATGEDIRKAFAKMNEEGEVFYNTMGRINDTIQGKEGFISDTWREFLTSFAEASGLADMYKAALDTVYEALQGIVDWLQKINENPVYKAIFQGVLVTAITALTFLIGGALLIALKQVIAHLTAIAALQAAINPLKAVAGIAVAAGVTAGLYAIVNGLTDVKNAANEADDAMNKLYGRKSSEDIISETITALENNIKNNNSEIEEATKKIQFYKKTMTESAKVAQQFKTAGEWASGTGRFDLLLGDPKKMQSEWESAKNGKTDFSNEINYWQERLDRATSFGDLLEKQLGLHKEMTAEENQYKKAQEEIVNIQACLLSSNEKSLKELESQIKEISGTLEQNRNGFRSRDLVDDGSYGYVVKNLSPALVKEYEKAKAIIEKKALDLKIKIAVENLTDWQNFLRKAFELSDKEVYDMGNVNEKNSFNHFDEKNKKQQNRTQTFREAGLINIDNLALAEQKLESVNKLIQAYATADQKNIDKSSLELLKIEQNNALLDLYDAQIASYDEQLNLLQLQSAEMEKQQRIKALMNQGFDEEKANTLYEKEKQYNDEVSRRQDIFGHLSKQMAGYFESVGMSAEASKTLADGITNIVSTQIPNGLVNGFEAIGQAMAEGADAGDAMKKIFVQMMQQMLSSLATACITAGVQLIAQGGWAGIPPALALFALGGVAGIGAGALSSLSSSSSSADEAQQEQLELLKKLNEEYSNLYDALLEQEEYYLKTKTRINAETYKESVTSVNDMILTPNGVFSTHPEDTIMAMKHPEDLIGGSGAVNVYVTVNNSVSNIASVSVNKSTDENGNINIDIDVISQKIAEDFVSGENGWSSAVQEQAVNQYGTILVGD